MSLSRRRSRFSSSKTELASVRGDGADAEPAVVGRCRLTLSNRR